MADTIKVTQLKDPVTKEPISPVVNVGSIYSKNGQKVDNLLSYKVAGTNIHPPALKDIQAELIQNVTNEVKGTLNIAATLTNKNLLDNWYFADPVNRRGQATYGHNPVYSIDRWSINNDYAFVDINNGHITIRGNDINGYGGIIQKLEDSVKNALIGKTVTLSVLMKPHTAISIAGRQVCDAGDDTFSIYSATFNGTTADYVVIRAVSPVSPGEPIADIIAAKLELGSKQTLARQDETGTWILNDPPPDKNLEALKCSVNTADPSDPCANKVLATRDRISNTNLLDNWYFADPINQRNGYVIPPGETYYTFDWTPIGTTDKYYPVLLRRDAANNYDCEIEVGGTRYVVAGAAGVRGYTEGGYGIDRWRFNYDLLSLCIYDGYVTITNSASWYEGLCQKIEPSLMAYLIGKTVTASILLHDGNCYSTTFTVSAGTNHNYFEGAADSLAFYYDTTGSLFVCTVAGGCAFSPVAVKLELGTVQTLAHQDENGNWVLNDPPPNKQQELEKCRKYARWICGGYNGYIDNANDIQLSVPEIRDMRATPVISNITWDRYVAISGGEGAYLVSSDYQTHLVYNGLRIGNTGLSISKYLPVSIVFEFIAFLSADL